MSLPAIELQSAIDELKALFGERLSTSTGVRDHHSKDESWHHPHRPDAVVFPNTTEEVAEIVRVCARHNTPVIERAVATIYMLEVGYEVYRRRYEEITEEET